MSGHVATLVQLTSLQQRMGPGMLQHRLPQRFRTIQHVQHGNGKIDPALDQIIQQLADHRRVFTGALSQPENRFGPVHRDSQRNDQMLALELDAVETDHAEREFIQRPLYNLAQFLATHAHEMLGATLLEEIITALRSIESTRLAVERLFGVRERCRLVDDLDLASRSRSRTRGGGSRRVLAVVVGPDMWLPAAVVQSSQWPARSPSCRCYHFSARIVAGALLTKHQPVAEGRLTKAPLVEGLADVADLTKKHAKVVVDTVLGSIVDALHRGEKVELRGSPAGRVEAAAGRRADARRGSVAGLSSAAERTRADPG